MLYISISSENIPFIVQPMPVLESCYWHAYCHTHIRDSLALKNYEAMGVLTNMTE